MSDQIAQREEARKNETMQIAEEARETEWQSPSFVAELFLGRFRPELLHPYPAQSDKDREIGDRFVSKVMKFAHEKIDADAIDRTGELPQAVLDGLTPLGCWGMKIGKEYGGEGLSQTNYNRVIQALAAHCANTTVTLSAHQSIGVPQPLKYFGTEEQKKKYLPRLAKGAISAFALTEPGVGSDPAKMMTTATPTPDGQHYIINGEKLWCTNGTIADILIVMARTPSVMVRGKERKQITAFIVEKSMPGFEIVHSCKFMGLRAISNGLIRFNNVKVPKENIVWGTGKGLKLALMTLNTGRLTLPAACVGMSKKCLQIIQKWVNLREQWGRPIGKHEAIASKIADITANTFAMEAMTFYTSALVDKGGHDIRLEAAMSKLFGSEAGWKIVDQTVQIRGGRGYETADSLKGRGDEPIAVERFMRDARINMIIEGSSEIMNLFIAREALDTHMRLLQGIIKPGLSLGARSLGAFRMLAFYLVWYPRQWASWFNFTKSAPLPGNLGGQFRYVARTSHRLARQIFHAMMCYQLGLEKKQALLSRAVGIGMELFAIAITASFAASRYQKDPTDKTPLELSDLFYRQSRVRVAQQFRQFFNGDDAVGYKMSQKFNAGEMDWLTDGV